MSLRSSYVWVLALLLLGASSRGLHAQLVVVRPGYVKAPFVRVYTYPDGSSYVRAPFVGVRGAPRPFYPPPAGMTVSPRQPTMAAAPLADLSMADWSVLRQVVRDNLSSVQARLRTVAEGGSWSKRLGLNELSGMVAFDGDAPLAENQRRALEQRWPEYERIGSQPDVAFIVRDPRFMQLVRAVRELLEPPTSRLVRQATDAGTRMQAEFGRMINGQGWREYLALPAAARAVSDSGNSTPAQTDIAKVQSAWTKLLERMDQVAVNPDFAVIAQLPEFQETHRRVGVLVAWMANPPADEPAQTAPQTPGPQVEEVPLPRPELPAIPVPPKSDTKTGQHSVLKTRR